MTDKKQNDTKKQPGIGPRPLVEICAKCGGLGSTPLNGKSYNRKTCPECGGTGVANWAAIEAWHTAKRMADDERRKAARDEENA